MNLKHIFAVQSKWRWVAREAFVARELHRVASRDRARTSAYGRFQILQPWRRLPIVQETPYASINRHGTYCKIYTPRHAFSLEGGVATIIFLISFTWVKYKAI